MNKEVGHPHQTPKWQAPCSWVSQPLQLWEIMSIVYKTALFSVTVAQMDYDINSYEIVSGTGRNVLHTFWQFCWVDAIMTAISQIKKLRCREVGCLVQSLTAMNGYQGDLISSPCFQAGICTSSGREYVVCRAPWTKASTLESSCPPTRLRRNYSHHPPGLNKHFYNCLVYPQPSMLLWEPSSDWETGLGIPRSALGHSEFT